LIECGIIKKYRITPIVGSTIGCNSTDINF
jgi:hypothetical protein